MAIVNDRRLIAIVAQHPFETQSGQFCKLAPWMYIDGELVDEKDFINDGEIWWMLVSQTAALAVAGKIVSIEIEEAPQFNPNDPNNSAYQVIRDSPRILNPIEPFEIIKLGASDLSKIEDLTDNDARIPVNYPPGRFVLLEWRGNIYGPFETQDWENDEFHGTYRTILRPKDQHEQVIVKLPFEEFQRRCGDFVRHGNFDISLENRARYASSYIKDIHYRLLLPEGLELFFSSDTERISLEPLEHAFLKQARNCLSRSGRKQLRVLLEEVKTNQAKAEDRETLLYRIGQVETLTHRQDQALDRLIDALLKSDLLGEDRIAQAEERYMETYIQKHAARLQGEIENHIGELRQKETKVQKELRRLKDEYEKEKRRQENEMAQKRREVEEACRIELEKLEEERKLLDMKQRTLTKPLEEAAHMLKDSSDKVMGNFLSIIPFLNNLGYDQDPGPGKNNGTPTPVSETTEFHIPEIILSPGIEENTELEETAFFERFLKVVEQNGFKYRENDLKRYHISVKCGDITILGGASGIGKSSLAFLYAMALAGNNLSSDRSAFLMVNVSPSWMEGRDLLGHVNTLEGRYYPAESGLYQHLVYAHEEFHHRGNHSALYLTCLDEMNLSQVEYYFSDFMQVLERPVEIRKINCFSPESVAPHCPFHKWSSIDIPPSVRFVGTVNFDETTRRLSDRLLDRANLIILRGDALPDVLADNRNCAWTRAEGRRICLDDFQRWSCYAALPAHLAELVDQLRNPLARLGSPLSPRCYRSICRFVASSLTLMDAEEALDIQIAQRLLGKVRSVVTESQHTALEELSKLIETCRYGEFPESCHVLEQIRVREVLLEPTYEG